MSRRFRYVISFVHLLLFLRSWKYHLLPVACTSDPQVLERRLLFTKLFVHSAEAQTIMVTVPVLTNGSHPAKHARLHPTAPISSEEIRSAAHLIRTLYPERTKLLFKQITLHEPAKEQLAPYLDAELDGRAPKSIDRRVFVNYYIRNTVCTLALCSAAFSR